MADSDRVQVVAERTGRFYGRKMTARHTYTIAGVAGQTRDPSEEGHGGPATKAFLADAVDVELDHAGNVVVADSGTDLAESDPPALGSLVRVVAERTGTFYGKKMLAGHLYTVAGTVAEPGLAGNGGLATRVWLGQTFGTVHVDHAGNLVVADNGDLPDRGIAPTVQVVAVRTGTFYGQKMTAGHIYAIAGDGKVGPSGDGGLATRAALASTAAVALDRAGNVVIADCARIRVVAERTGRFYRKKMTAGHIYSIAGGGPANSDDGDCFAVNDTGDGGPATMAHLAATGVAIDNAGNVVLANGPSIVRVVAVRAGSFYGRRMRAGDIYPVAGNGQSQSSGDGLSAASAELTPTGLAEDRAGDLVVTDSASNVSGLVRMVAAASGTLFGRKMTAGDIYTIAGDGQVQFSGDGGPATRAGLSSQG